MLIIPDKCLIPKGDTYGYDWVYDKDLYKQGIRKYTKKPVNEVPKSLFIWDDVPWKINLVESNYLSTKITVERQEEPCVILRTGLYCPQQLIGKSTFINLMAGLEDCSTKRKEVNFCYPNSDYLNKNIFCGIREVSNIKPFNLSDMGRKRDTFLQY